ncbi:MAG: hypothetical protein H8E94_08085, partial [Alphaproteobacteria bacterium]|nr:hypothetical protein [Alphaproteobacteria bacterium]
MCAPPCKNTCLAASIPLAPPTPVSSSACPFALAYLWLISTLDAKPLPTPNAIFAVYGAIGGVCQIMATFLLLRTFHYRNFAVGTTYSKTETVQTVLVGIIVLTEFPSLAASAGIGISLIGVMAISAAKTDGSLKGVLLSVTEKPALIGLASGGLFGITAVCYRAASLSLGGDFLPRASVALVCVIIFQTVVMTLYLAATDRAQIIRVFKEWRLTI